MRCFFWDTGVLIGYCFYIDEEKLPKGMKIQDIDPHSFNANKFVRNTTEDKHVIAQHSIKNETKRKFAHRKLCIKMLILQASGSFKLNDQLFFQLKDKDWEWIDDKKELFKKYDKDSVTNIFTDIIAKLEVRRDYLLANVIKTVHEDFDWDIYKQCKELLGIDDGKIFATALNYHNKVQQIEFITTDKHFEDTKSLSVNIKLPSIILLWNFS